MRAMMKRIAAVLGLLLISGPWVAFSAPATERLRDFVQNVQSATGEFSQVTLNEAGQADGVAQKGIFSFQRPGKFRWQVRQPYEQLTLADGAQLYQYDPDLLQVIVRSIDDSVGASPAAILFGSGDLDDSFNVESLPDQDGLSWLRATPRSGDAGFVHVDIGFRDAVP